MNKVNRSVFILFLIFVFSVVVINCNKKSKSKNDSANNREKEQAIPVEVAEVISGNIEAYYSSTAPLETEEETEVVAKVSGVVKEILIEEGDYVKTDQVLAKLDDERLSLQMEQARAALKKLENEYGRSQELYEKKIISAEDFQKAKYDYEYQKSAYDLVKLDLDHTAIRTPIGGVVADRLIKVGNMIMTNQPVYRVTGINPLLAVLYIPERHLGKLHIGQSAHIRVDALNNEKFLGKIKRISPIVDPQTGTLKVTIEIYDKTQRLKPGMFARVDIVYDTHNNTLLVPKDGVITEDKETSVFIVKDSLVFRKYVKTGYVNTSHIEIIEGIQEGDTIVTIGKNSIKDSTRVEFVNIDSQVNSDSLSDQ